MCICESVPGVVGVEQGAIAAEEVFLGVEDDDVANSRDEEEEGRFQLKTHPQKHATGDQRQYTIIYQVLERQTKGKMSYFFVSFFFFFGNMTAVIILP